MSQDSDLNQGVDDNNLPKTEWPSWFIEPDHPFERTVLQQVFQSNPQLSEVHFIVHMMQMNYLVFWRNFLEMVNLHKQFDRPINFREIALQTDMGQEIIAQTLIEFTRLIHNFLASAKMLVDVTRRWVRLKFTDTGFLETYQLEVTKRFQTNVQAQFLVDLRNFTLHRSLPLSIPELRMQKISDDRLKSSLGIVLLKDYLLEWNNWSEYGRMQIDMAFDGEVDILWICQKYFENVTEFNQWLFWQVRDQFGKEIDQINSIIEKMRGR